VPRKVSDKDIKELEKSAERVLGQPVEDFFFIQRLSVRTSDTDAYVQEREPVIDGVKIRCVDADVIDVSGRSTTGADGTTSWKLRDFIVPCDRGFDEFDRPMSFVATPHSTNPIYLTIRHPGPFMAYPSDDVVVDVFTWDKDGKPAPNVTFSWRCRVPYSRIRIID
jgi:hypothetical protein